MTKYISKEGKRHVPRYNAENHKTDFTDTVLLVLVILAIIVIFYIVSRDFYSIDTTNNHVNVHIGDVI